MTKKIIKTAKRKKVEEVIGKTIEAIGEVAEDLGEEIGKITHYFDKLGVAVIEVAKALATGDKIRIKGATTDFIQKVESIQVEHKQVAKAKKGDAVGIKVKERVRPHDKVFLVEK